MRDSTIYHVVSRRDIADGKTLARCRRAWESWNCLYQHPDVIPVNVWENEAKRTSKTIGSKRSLPFLVDVLKVGMARTNNPYDIVMFTNDDNILHPMLIDEVKRHAALYAVGSAHRVEMDVSNEQMPAMFSPPVAFLQLGKPHVGRDLFIFNAGWLQENIKMIPDFLLGSWGWDICLAQLVRLTRGVRTSSVNELYDVVEGCELPDGLVIHQSHKPVWNDGDWEKLPENLYNKQTYEKWNRLYSVDSVTSKALLVKHEFPISAVVRCPGYMRACEGSYKTMFSRL